MNSYKVINGWLVDAGLPQKDKNWLAVISAGGRTGLTRAFLPQGQRSTGLLYGIGALKVGDPLEWGADEVIPAAALPATRIRHRKYEVVIGRSGGMLYCREFPSAVLAISAAILVMDGKLPEEAVFDRMIYGGYPLMSQPMSDYEYERRRREPLPFPSQRQKRQKPQCNNDEVKPDGPALRQFKFGDDDGEKNE